MILESERITDVCGGIAIDCAFLAAAGAAEQLQAPDNRHIFGLSNFGVGEGSIT